MFAHHHHQEEHGGKLSFAEILFAIICVMCAVLELVLGVSSFFSNTQPLIEDFETIQNAVLNLGPQEANDHFTCYKINPQFPNKGQVAPVETEWAFVHWPLVLAFAVPLSLEIMVSVGFDGPYWAFQHAFRASDPPPPPPLPHAATAETPVY